MDFDHFCYSQFERDQRSQLNNETFSKISFAIEVLGICLPEVKKRERERRERRRIRVSESQSKALPKIFWKYSLEVLSRYLPYEKDILNCKSEVFLSLFLKILAFFHFANIPVRGESRVIV